MPTRALLTTSGCRRRTWRSPDHCDEQLGRHGCDPARHGRHHLDGRWGDHLGRADLLRAHAGCRLHDVVAGSKLDQPPERRPVAVR